MKLPLLLLPVLAILAGCRQATAQSMQRSTQLIVVTTADWNTVQGKLQRYGRSNASEPWKTVGQPIQVVVGKNGMAWGIGLMQVDARSVRESSDPIKKEGDGTSPAGIFTLGHAFGDAQKPLEGIRLTYQALTPSIECVDDPASKHYNSLVDRTAVTVDWKSSEHMRDVGEAYRWGVVVEQNFQHGRAVVPSGGSCVFLHISQNLTHGTAGCTAMPQSELESVMRWLDPNRNPLLVQLPKDTYKRVATRWQLPAEAIQ